jgi:hypothetical protein
MQVDFPLKKKDNKERISGQYKMFYMVVDFWRVF